VIRTPALSHAIFQGLQRLDTCIVSNAIERLNGRVRNEGSISGSVLHCMFPNLPPMLGYAVTGRMRSTTQPVVGRTYHENLHWWRYVETIPEPRVLIVQDADERPGSGALFGEMHTLIAMALKCVGYITNGSVRDLPAVSALGFQMFAGSVAVTHMYAHISQHGEPVEIGGLEIFPGDLVHGDRHGVQTIPFSVAPEIPAMASAISEEENELRRFCGSPEFSVQALEEKLQHLPGDGFELPVNGRE
jgi:4-hydroxy-4-methyl-2-oxoglutarate aldolase